jgi:hypothetical protein
LLVTAFHRAFLTAAVLIAIGGLVALRIRDADAAASMRRRARAPAAVQSAVAESTAESGVTPPESGVAEPGNA